MARNDNDGATRLGARNGRDRDYDETRDSNRDVSTNGQPAHAGEARDKFGGVNIGASFFGWIVAIGIAILLTSIVGAIGTAVGFSGNLSQTDAERQAGTIGIVSAIVLLLVLMVAYYAGGYVAGRMSRFDGGRQGFVVWLIGLLVTIARGRPGRRVRVAVQHPRPGQPAPVARQLRPDRLGRPDHGCCRDRADAAVRGHGRQGRAPLPRPSRSGRSPMTAGGATNDLFVAFGVGFGAAVALTGVSPSAGGRTDATPSSRIQDDEARSPGCASSQGS